MPCLVLPAELVSPDVEVPVAVTVAVPSAAVLRCDSVVVAVESAVLVRV